MTVQREVSDKCLRFVTTDEADVAHVVKEVIDHDCYGIRGLKPFPQFVIDGGACFGAFTLFVWALGTSTELCTNSC